ncbi:MAG: T9SS type A sorting domain-containing protein [Bacteroidetes bacterium]|nr:T9SS type A sorting domain-containing protein [Bacteroidota bacterium]
MNNFLNQTINNITIQREATLNNNLENAELQNDYVVNGELPETNSKLINEIEIEYLERGNDIQYLIDNYSGILAIASQCPFAGGSAVERARSYVALINDSVYYDDLNICLQSGIYRFSKNDSLNIKDENSITVKPNPANDKVEIKLIGKFEGVCKTEFINAFGQTSLVEEMNCSETLKSINVSSLQQGIYIIKVYINNQISLINKVAIIR